MSGLSRTPGKRVWVNSPPRVRIPPAPPDFKKALVLKAFFYFQSAQEQLGCSPGSVQQSPATHTGSGKSPGKRTPMRPAGPKRFNPVAGPRQPSHPGDS